MLTVQWPALKGCYYRAANVAPHTGGVIQRGAFFTVSSMVRFLTE